MSANRPGCTICAHERVAEIDRALEAGEPLERLLNRLALPFSETSLSTHMHECRGIWRSRYQRPQWPAAAPRRPTCPGATPIGGLLFCEAGCPYYSHRLAHCPDWGRCSSGDLSCCLAVECVCMVAKLRGPAWAERWAAFQARWRRYEQAEVAHALA